MSGRGKIVGTVLCCIVKYAALISILFSLRIVLLSFVLGMLKW